MQRLDYHVIVQNNGVVHAELNDGERTIPSGLGQLRLDKLELITKDYLPMLDTGPKQTRDRMERFGKLLYELLFSSIQGHFEEQAWRKIMEQPSYYHLALALTLQEGLQADVMALPWEFLYYERDRIFLATDPRISFSRLYTDWISSPATSLTKAEAGQARPQSTQVQAEAARILLVRLQPKDMAPVALAPVRNTLNELAETHHTMLKPYILENPTPLELETELQRYRPHIVHFLLHGRFSDRGTHFALIDKAGQTVRWYGDRSFADLFNIWRPHLVLLQACEGGRSSDLLSFMNGAAWLMRGHIPSVIAMHYPITNQVGWTFAQMFYACLAEKDDLDRAIQQARRTLAKSDTASQIQDDHATRDFAAPILWVRPETQRLFADEEVSPMNIVNLTITTPDEGQYAATISTNTLIDQVMRAFLSQWQPPTESHAAQRYSLQTREAIPLKLDPSSTLREAGLADRSELMLVPEPLDPYEPIRLTIEDELKKEYTATILANTQVRQLAEAFLKEKPDAKDTPDMSAIVVEWISGSTRTRTRPLRLDASLYEQGVNDDASLRIYRISSSVKG